MLAEIHGEHEIHLVTNDQVIGFAGGNRVEARIDHHQGAGSACNLVVVAIGIEPVVDALTGSGIALDNEILVNSYLQTNVPDVYAAGDVANLLHPVFGRVRVEHYNNAEKQGRAVARAVLGTRQAYDYIYSFWSNHQYEHNLEYVGFARKWERIVLRGQTSTAESSWPST